MTFVLAALLMVAVAGALSLKVLLGRESEVKRFGCGNFDARDPGATSCGVCGAATGEACRSDGQPVSAEVFSRN